MRRESTVCLRAASHLRLTPTVFFLILTVLVIEVPESVLKKIHQ